MIFGGGLSRGGDAESHDYGDLNSDGADVIEASGPPRRKSPKWLPFAVMGVVIVLGIMNHSRGKAPTDRPTPEPSAPAASTPASPRPGEQSTVVVEELHHPLLGVTAGWELFGRGDGVVVRLELAKGRITRTAIPALNSGGPVSFIVTPNLAFIRPADVVPGWIVPDGEVAQGTPQTLNHGLAFPAPAPQVWVQKNGTSVSLLLLDGTLTGLDILVPPGSSVMSDGTNGLVLSDADGAHYFAPDGWQKITSGNLLAIGPTRWLAWECEGNLCQTMVIDRSNGVRITLPDLQGVNYLPGGTIAPDGSVAALLRDGRLDLVDLVTGEVRHLPVEIPDPHGPSYSDRVVFSPDSRWLLVTDKDGALKIFHARTGQFVNLGVDLPPLYQLAVRNGLPG